MSCSIRHLLEVFRNRLLLISEAHGRGGYAQDYSPPTGKKRTQFTEEPGLLVTGGLKANTETHASQMNTRKKGLNTAKPINPREPHGDTIEGQTSTVQFNAVRSMGIVLGMNTIHWSRQHPWQ